MGKKIWEGHARAAINYILLKYGSKYGKNLCLGKSLTNTKPGFSGWQLFASYYYKESVPGVIAYSNCVKWGRYYGIYWVDTLIYIKYYFSERDFR